MRNTKKLVGLLLALVMVFAMSATVFAQTVSGGSGSGSITISNAAKGETYTIYKLFDATVTGTADGSIAYTGTIPESLTAYFTVNAQGNISATEAAWTTTGGAKEMSEGLRTALTEWAKTATETASAESDGSTLTFANLPYGYYVVKTTQGEQAISVDSTNPTVSIVDKNSTTPNTLTKDVDDDDVFIGQTVTYTVTFKTSNYNGAGTAAKKIVTYTIEDTLPEFLDNVTVTSITVDNDADTATTTDRVEIKNTDGSVPQFVDKKIELDWYDETNGKFLYDNGALVTITYTAVVTDEAEIDGSGNTNKVTLTWTVEGGGDGGKLEDEETIFTYAIALKKVDDKGNPLAGAVFEFPFYVKATPDTDGAYIHAGNTAADGLTNQITTPADGVIVVKGVASGKYSITEVTAPNGYNKLLAPVSVTAVKTGETTTHTTIYLDENGNVVETATDTKVEVILNDIAAATIVVVNKTGTELPSTGGIGTTIFYVIGGVLVIGAAAMLIAKRKKA
ncbi:MAG: SpaH/EbpB family LPXTG-anchored major pilin [Clostridiales bacterium]|nr:SpaH/EbpB family LPXTG-anchored major pilin [Clostridiales bacterium]